jgi:small subunit ribosomal protein S17
MADEEQQDVEQPEEQEQEAAEPQAAEEAPAPEPEPSADAEAPADTPVAEAEAETPKDATEEAGEETPAEEAAVAEAPAQKRKRKRLPRSLRRQRTKPKGEKPAERKPIARAAHPSETQPGRKQERRGVVVSSAMDKTIVVRVDTVKAHSRYKKVVRRSRRFHAHDAENQANVGDVVRIVETRPMSKMKAWRLVEVVEQAK